MISGTRFSNYFPREFKINCFLCLWTSFINIYLLKKKNLSKQSIPYKTLCHLIIIFTNFFMFIARKLIAKQTLQIVNRNESWISTFLVMCFTHWRSEALQQREQKLLQTNYQTRSTHQWNDQSSYMIHFCFNDILTHYWPFLL